MGNGLLVTHQPLEDKVRLRKRLAAYRARVESTRKAHIRPPIDNSKSFGDPPFLTSVGEAVAAGVVVVAALIPVADDDVAEVVVAA
jgi:hypothetical protein